MISALHCFLAVTMATALSAQEPKQVPAERLWQMQLSGISG